MTMYHVTARRNVELILVEGLRTDVGGWDTHYVWMFDDEATALEAALVGSFGGSRGDNAIIEVDVAGLAVMPDPHPGWGRLMPGWDDHAFAHDGSIPVDRLRELLPV